MEAVAVIGLEPSFEAVDEGAHDRAWREAIVEVSMTTRDDGKEGWEIIAPPDRPQSMFSWSPKHEMKVLIKRYGTTSGTEYATAVAVSSEKPDDDYFWRRIDETLEGDPAEIRHSGKSAWLWVRWARLEPRFRMEPGVTSLRWVSRRYTLEKDDSSLGDLSEDFRVGPGKPRYPINLAYRVGLPLGVAGVERKVAVLDAWPPQCLNGADDDDEFFEIPRSLPMFVFADQGAAVTARRRDAAPVPEFSCFSLTESNGQRYFVSSLTVAERLDDANLRKRLVRSLRVKHWRGEETLGDDDEDDDGISDAGSDDSDFSSLAYYAPTAICVFWRRRGLHEMTRRLSSALHRIALSSRAPGPRLRLMLAACRGLTPPPAASRIREARASFVDGDGREIHQLAPLTARTSRLERAGLEPVGAASAWKFATRFSSPDAVVRVVEVLLLERPLVACSTRAAEPALFLDALEALLFPLSWTMPRADRLPGSMAAELLDDCVVPLMAGVVLPRGIKNLRAFLSAGDSACVVDLDAGTVDVDDERTQMFRRASYVSHLVAENVRVLKHAASSGLSDVETDSSTNNIQNHHLPRAPAGPRKKFLDRITALRGSDDGLRKRPSHEEEDTTDWDVTERSVEGYDLRDAALEFLTELLSDFNDCIRGPSEMRNFFESGFDGYFDKDTFVQRTADRVGGRDFIEKLAGTQSFATLAQRYVEMDPGDRGLIFFNKYRAAQGGFDAVVGDLGGGSSTDAIAHLRVPILVDDSAPPKPPRPGRYGAFAGLYDDNALDQYSAAVEAVAKPVEAHQAEVSAHSSDAETFAAAYRRNLLVRAFYHDDDDLTKENKTGSTTSASSSSRALLASVRRRSSKLVAAARTIPSKRVQDDDDDDSDDKSSSAGGSLPHVLARRSLVDLYSTYFACVPRLVRRHRVENSEDGELTLVMIRALGLLARAMSSGVNDVHVDEAVWRALLLGAAQLRAFAETDRVRHFAANLARHLYKAMIGSDLKPGPSTFALYAAAVAVDSNFDTGTDAVVVKGDDIEPSEAVKKKKKKNKGKFIDIAARRVSWLDRAGRAWCEERGLECPVTWPLENLAEAQKESDDDIGPLPLVGIWLEDGYDSLVDLVMKRQQKTSSPKLGVHRWRFQDDDAFETTTVPYLSPSELRRRLETVLLDRGEKALEMTSLLRTAPDLYVNILWYFPRLHVPVPTRSSGAVLAVVHGLHKQSVLHRCQNLLKQETLPVVQDGPSVKTNHQTGDDGHSDDADVCRSIFGTVSLQQTFFVFS